jgi:hypothetical protein
VLLPTPTWKRQRLQLTARYAHQHVSCNYLIYLQYSCVVCHACCKTIESVCHPAGQHLCQSDADRAEHMTQARALTKTATAAALAAAAGQPPKAYQVFSLQLLLLQKFPTAAAALAAAAAATAAAAAACRKCSVKQTRSFRSPCHC